MCTALLKHAYAIFLNAGAAHRFAESEVTIHYRSPIRNLQQSGQQQVGIHLTFWRTLLNWKTEYSCAFMAALQTDIDEEELRQMQAEHMRRVYEQERRRKYIQELEDIESRRHMDNFTSVSLKRTMVNETDLKW